MIVYGDHARRGDPRAEMAAIDHRLQALAAMPPGLDRHAELAAALIALGEVAQGVADADLARCGVDRRTPASDVLGQALLDLARALLASWDSGFAFLPPLPAVQADLALPAAIEMRLPEGFAYYALYPEAVAAAARTLRLKASPRVIGIRSIGTTLGAIAAAALDAPPPITVRPTGHPFAREIAIADSDAATLLDGDANYVVVDEGPGLSGSSLAAVHRWLAERGVPRDRVAFLPSHGGEPGHHASAQTRALWRDVQRAPADRHTLLGSDVVQDWVATLLGPLDSSLEPISGGGWRAHRWPDPAAWPAAYVARERPKWLARAKGVRWLVKFVGVGDAGQRACAAARRLGEDGLSPRVAGIAYGLLVEEWVEGTTPDPHDPRHLSAAAHFIAERARLLPAPLSPGASLDTLKHMATHNVGEAFGDGEAAWLRERFEAGGEAAPRPVWIDGRLDLVEWRVRADGRLCKCDAVDHARAHDLVGAQDITWDVAGLLVEWAPDAKGRALVQAVLAKEGIAIDLQLLRTLKRCYAAFRLGEAEMARASTADEREAARLTARIAHLHHQILSGNALR